MGGEFFEVLGADLKTELGGLAGEFGHNTINFNGPRCECGNYGCLEKYCSFIFVVFISCYYSC